jgi:hypothetical protein
MTEYILEASVKLGMIEYALVASVGPCGSLLAKGIAECHYTGPQPVTLLAEFAINNTFNESLKITPFFANYEYHPRFEFEPITPKNRSAAKNAKKLALKIKTIHKYLKSKIDITQTRHKKYANQKRKPAYKFYISLKV